jgi:formamidopyrimidine-DNA glycosylase
MPELPEVHTTTEGLKKNIKGLTIKTVWTDYYKKTTSKAKNNIKNKSFFEKLKKEIVGKKVIDAQRRGKNILVHIEGGKTLLIHMKMTGHLLYGNYEFDSKNWIAKDDGPLKDPFNKFIHFLIGFKNGKSLAFSDMRKFAKITLFETKNKESHPDLSVLGPEPLAKLDFYTLKKQLYKKPSGKIKTILMDQTVLAGIGNIYSDEILWASSIHPERIVKNITDNEIKKILKNTVAILNKSISLGGDSMSDYRNIDGVKGLFQNSHKVYRQTNKKCQKKGCNGVIKRKIIGGRSGHFCPKHQI